MSPRLRAKVDTNQADVVAVLRAVGATVQPLHQLGRGVPDLLVGFRSINYLLELKSGSRDPLTPDEAAWHAGWTGRSVRVVRSVDEALVAIGAVAPTQTEGARA